jgi:hypothetical protein
LQFKKRQKPVASTIKKRESRVGKPQNKTAFRAVNGSSEGEGSKKDEGYGAGKAEGCGIGKDDGCGAGKDPAAVLA